MTGTHRYRKNGAAKFRYGSRNCASNRSIALRYSFYDSSGLCQCTASPFEHLFGTGPAAPKKRSILPPSQVGRINRASLHGVWRLGTIPNTRSAALLWPNCSQTLRLSRQPCQGEDCERDTARKRRSLCRRPDRVRCHGRQATGADLQQVRLAPNEFFVGKLSLIMLGEQLLQFLAYRAPGHGPLLSGGRRSDGHRRRNGRAASGCAKRTRFRNVSVAFRSCPGNNNPKGRRRGVYRQSGCNFVSPKSA